MVIVRCSVSNNSRKIAGLSIKRRALLISVEDTHVSKRDHIVIMLKREIKRSRFVIASLSTRNNNSVNLKITSYGITDLSDLRNVPDLHIITYRFILVILNLYKCINCKYLSLQILWYFLILYNNSTIIYKIETLTIICSQFFNINFRINKKHFWEIIYSI